MFRFLKQNQLLWKFEYVLPNKIIKLNEHEINETIDVILKQWPSIADTSVSIIKSEALLWQRKWLSANEKPRIFIDTLNQCSKIIYSHVFKILKYCSTIPTTVATGERSFSTLKRIKTYLRNATGENRLNGLAALSVHGEIDINCNEVIDVFNKKERRMLL